MSKTLTARRPAETGAIASALALLIARSVGVDDVDTVTAMAIVIGAVPMAITWVVELTKKSKRKR